MKPDEPDPIPTPDPHPLAAQVVITADAEVIPGGNRTDEQEEQQ